MGQHVMGHKPAMHVMGHKPAMKTSRSSVSSASTVKVNKSAVDPGFKHKYPNDFVQRFSEDFRAPDVLAKGHGGVAIWYAKPTEQITIAGQRVRNVFTEHWCRDELIKHDCPAPHRDFFYSYVDVNLKDSTWHKCISISGSIGYDPLKKKLYARCASIEANIATLHTALLINSGKVTLEQVQKDGMYGKAIKSTQDPANTIRMYRELPDMLPKRVNQTGYWTVAFPKKC